MNFFFLFKGKNDKIESLKEQIRIKTEEIAALQNASKLNLNLEIIRSEKAIEFFKAHPEIPGPDDYKAFEYRWYLAENIRKSRDWDYIKLRELREPEETKARRQIEKKYQ